MVIVARPGAGTIQATGPATSRFPDGTASGCSSNSPAETVRPPKTFVADGVRLVSAKIEQKSSPHLRPM
jgi:hypothetical protein